MTTLKQRRAAQQNIKRAQARWHDMSRRQHAQAQPEGRGRRKPGSTGRGSYYHIEVRSKGDFTTFRTQDVGRRGHIQRVAGQRPSGSWATVAWLIGKDDAHVQDGRLVPDTKAAEQVIGQLAAKPVRMIGDRFKARPRPNVPESAKPTPAQKRARRQNVRKAQAARQRG
jgi:hypothetical protein